MRKSVINNMEREENRKGRKREGGGKQGTEREVCTDSMVIEVLFILFFSVGWIIIIV